MVCETPRFVGEGGVRVDAAVSPARWRRKLWRTALLSSSSPGRMVDVGVVVVLAGLHGGNDTLILPASGCIKGIKIYCWKSRSVDDTL